MPITVKLTENEIKEAKEVAKGRNENKVNTKRNSWSKTVNSKETSYLNHLFGVKCEMSIAKILGIEIDKASYGNKGDKGQPDLWYGGISIQIKGRKTEGWQYALGTNRISDFNADIGMLVYPSNREGLECSSVIIQGYITKKIFEDRAKISNYGYGERLVIDPCHFLPLSKKALIDNYMSHINNSRTERTIEELEVELYNCKDNNQMKISLELIKEKVKKEERVQILRGK